MEKNIPRYSPSSLEVAQEIAVTPADEMDTADRWTQETSATLELLRGLQSPTSVRDIIDFGTGPGRLLPGLLSDFPLSRIVSIDTSQAMLDFARNAVPPEMRSRVRFARYTGIEDLELTAAEDSADLAVAVYVLQHVAQAVLPAVISFLHSRLREGGSLFVINLYVRAVPLIQESELDPAERDAAIHNVATKMTPHGQAWVDDGVDVRAMLRRSFTDERALDLPESGFSASIRHRHFCTVYRK